MLANKGVIKAVEGAGGAGEYFQYCFILKLILKLRNFNGVDEKMIYQEK